MPKLRVLSGDDVCRILLSHGFAKGRQKGSHVALQRVILTKDEGGVEARQTITVIVPLHDEVKRGTLASIIRQSGLSRELFEVK